MLDIFRTLPGIVGDLEGAEVVREAIVFAAWKKIAGESLSAHTVPFALSGTTLRIAVSNRTWQRHLHDLCGQMIFKLNATLGSPMITYIDLRIDDRLVTEQRQKPSSAAKEEFGVAAKNEVSADLVKAAEAIADEDLRRAFLAAAGKCLLRTRRFGERMVNT